MYSFLNDYSEGCHPRILERLAATNLEQCRPYGADRFCERARELIREQAGLPGDVPVHFFPGGTQVNIAVITACLRPWQGVLSAISGHIEAPEAGAIEAAGHKVLTLDSPSGKLTAAQVEAAVQAYSRDDTAEHKVQPAMVYISNPTELGTVYTKDELQALSGVCRKEGLFLYLDGARLGCALTCEGGDLTLPDIAGLTDAFYIGGTKMGALIGEALVIRNPAIREGFRSIQKQRGGMLSKGRLLGVQFVELFTDGLYWELSRHANKMAGRLREGIAALGYPFLSDASANQLFPILPDKVSAQLQKEFAFSIWQRLDNSHAAIRLSTGWATPPEQVEAFLRFLRELSHNV